MKDQCNIEAPQEHLFQGSVYYRQRSILLVANSLMIGPNDKTHRRKSMRLFIGCSDEFTLGFEDGSQLQGRAALMSAESGICDIKGKYADIALLDTMAGTPEYVALNAFLQGKRQMQLDLASFESVLPTLIRAQEGSLTCDELIKIMSDLVLRLTGQPPAPLKLDPRVEKTLLLIEQLPLAEIKLARLSSEVNLSPDRFRHLFKEATGTNVSQYARNNALWRALGMIENDSSVTDASIQAGFHDVSHFYRVYSETFGISVSEKSNPRKFRRVRYFN